jgi:hypothetical protein
MRAKCWRPARPSSAGSRGRSPDPGAALGAQAILRALDVVRREGWFAGCRVWLYRGAWQASAPACWQAAAAAARSSRTWLRGRACLLQTLHGC